MNPTVATPARWLAASAVLAAVWVFGSQLLVPPLIEKAYDGQSHALVNRVISGQERHGVEHYFRYWIYLTRIGAVLILAAGTALYLFRTRQLGGRVPLLDDLADRDTLTVKQSIRFGLLALAVAAGSGITSSLVSTGLGYRAFIDAIQMERGGIQLATFGFLALATMLAFFTALRHRNLRVNYLLISFLMIAYSCRELDFPIMLRIGRPGDKWVPFFQGPTHILFKINFALLILAIGLAIVLLIRRESIFQALARREAWAIYGLVWSIMLAGTQYIDKAPIGMELRYSTFEEPFEMFAAAVCFVSLYTLAYRDSSAAGQPDG